MATAVELGVPTPCFSTALAFYDGYRSERLPANLIQVRIVLIHGVLMQQWQAYYVLHFQAQRDYFGAHTYELLSSPGKFIHTNWTGTGGNVSASTYSAWTTTLTMLYRTFIHIFVAVVNLISCCAQSMQFSVPSFQELSYVYFHLIAGKHKNDDSSSKIYTWEWCLARVEVQKRLDVFFHCPASLWRIFSHTPSALSSRDVFELFIRAREDSKPSPELAANARALKEIFFCRVRQQYCQMILAVKKFGGCDVAGLPDGQLAGLNYESLGNCSGFCPLNTTCIVLSHSSLSGYQSY